MTHEDRKRKEGLGALRDFPVGVRVPHAGARRLRGAQRQRGDVCGGWRAQVGGAESAADLEAEEAGSSLL